MQSLYQFYSEIRPPAPHFTSIDLSDLSSKVYLVTGGASGVGLELCKLLYSASATIYILGRSAQNAAAAISEIQSAHPASKGTLRFIHIDLSDLSTVKPAADEFLKHAERLDVVWHNAGVMIPPAGSKDAQGHDLQLGTNAIAPWLLQHFLTPLLQRTAAMPETPKDSIRVIWVASVAITGSPYPGGINWEDINFEHWYQGITGMFTMDGRVFQYAQSKAANVILAAEAAKRWHGTGVLSLSLNPGNLKSKLDRTSPWWMKFILQNFVMYPASFGSLTELFAGLSPEVSEERNGAYIIPWGRFGEPRADIKNAFEENGERLWAYCESECRQFM